MHVNTFHILTRILKFGISIANPVVCVFLAHDNDEMADPIKPRSQPQGKLVSKRS